MRPPARKATPDEIRLARERLGLTQLQFARLLGYKRYNSISDWERGTVEPKISAARIEELVTAHEGIRPEGHLVEPRAYADQVLASLAAEVSAFHSQTIARLDEARRVLGLPEVPTVPAAEVDLGLAELAAPAPTRQRKRRGRAR